MRLENPVGNVVHTELECLLRTHAMKRLVVGKIRTAGHILNYVALMDATNMIKKCTLEKSDLTLAKLFSNMPSRRFYLKVRIKSITLDSWLLRPNSHL